MSLKNWLSGGKDKDKPEASPQETPPHTTDTEEGSTPPPTAMEKPASAVTLEEITRGMQMAASSANQLIAHQYMQALDSFFDHSDDGSLTPRSVTMQLDEANHFELPLIALATPRGLMLEKMNVHLTIRADAVDQLPIEGAGDNVSRFYVSMSPSSENNGRDSRHVDIEMQFIALEPPESVMRLIDEYTNRILPIPNKRNVEDA